MPVTIGESVSFLIGNFRFVNVTDLVIVQSSFAPFYNVSVADAVTIGEAYASDQSLKEPVVAEAITIGELATPNLRSYVNLTDAVTTGESVSGVITYQARVTDTITTGEVFNTPGIGALFINLTDGITALESLSFHRTAPTNFGFYKPLTIQTGEVPSLQSNLAVLLPFIAGDNQFRSVANGGHVQNANGFDIRPYADAGTFAVPLNYELVQGSYDPAQGSFEMWVNITAQDGAIIYLAYGNALCDFDGSLSATWDSNYTGDFHLSSGVGGRFIGVDTLDATSQNVPAPEVGGSDVNVSDSTSTATFTPTNHGAMEVVGPIGTAAGLSAIQSQYVSLGSPNTHHSILTVEAWVMLNATGTQMQIVTKGAIAGFTEWALFYNGAHIGFQANNGAPVGILGSTTLAAHTWYHVVGVYDGSAWRLYINGASDASAVTTTGPISTTAEHEIGAIQVNGTPGQFWDGAIDEVRISNSARLPSWITTEYNNQSNLSAFWLTGAEVNNGNINVTDALTVSESVSLSPSGTLNVSDAVTIGETATPNLRSYLNVTDAVAVGERVTEVVLNKFTIDAFETILVTEIFTANIVTPLQVVATEAISIGESPRLSLSIPVRMTDAIMVGEAITVLRFIPGVKQVVVDEIVTLDDDPPLSLISYVKPCVPFRSNASVSFNRRGTIRPNEPKIEETVPADCEDELVSN